MTLRVTHVLRQVPSKASRGLDRKKHIQKNKQEQVKHYLAPVLGEDRTMSVRVPQKHMTHSTYNERSRPEQRTKRTYKRNASLLSRKNCELSPALPSADHQYSPTNEPDQKALPLAKTNRPRYSLTRRPPRTGLPAASSTSPGTHSSTIPYICKC